MPALILIAAAPVAPHGTACRHGSSGIGVPVGGSTLFGGVCLFSDQMMESKPPAGPSGVPSCGLQSALSPRAPGGGSVRCAPPSPRFPANRKGSAGLSRDCPARIRFAWDSPPAGAALMRSGRLIGVRSLPPPDHSGRGGSGRGTQATVAAFPFPHPTPLPSSVKRLPVAGSRRVLASVMPPAMWTAGVPPAALPRPPVFNTLPARPCRHSRQASAQGSSAPALVCRLPSAPGAPYSK